MAAILKHWREAATLILVSSSKLAKSVSFNLASSTTENVKDAEDYEILLLKRSSGSKFMPNKYVFPGGVADNTDFSKDWVNVYSEVGTDFQTNLFQKLSVGNASAAPIFKRKRDPEFCSIPSEVAFRLCAIRETFEESGVLVALPIEKAKTRTSSILSSDKFSTHHLLVESLTNINEWRDKVNHDPAEFLRMCQELQVVPAIWALYEWSNWLTPVLEAENARRFDTAFYICIVDDKPFVTECDRETVRAVWASPSVILCEYLKQLGSMAPPQVYEIAKLLNFPNADKLFRHVSDPQNERAERFLPVTMCCDGCFIGVMPGDELYPKQPELYSPLKELTTYPETPEELFEKYPKAHRSFHYRGGDASAAVMQVNVSESRKGQVLPNVKILNSLRRKSKL